MKGCKLLVVKALRPGPHCSNILRDESSLKSLSYNDLLGFLKNQSLLYPTNFCRYMNELGYDSAEVVFDFHALQLKWCEERGLKIPTENWHIEILKKQISEIKPDILYFERTLFGFPLSFRTNLRKEFPFLKLLTGYWGAQISDHSWIPALQQLDVVFCIDKVLYDAFTKANIKTVISPHCFDQCNLTFDTKKDHNVVFLGVSGYGFLDHYRRFQELKYLLENTSIEMWCWEYPKLTDEEQKIKDIAKIVTYLPAPILSFFLQNTIIKSNRAKEILRQALILKKMETKAPWYENEIPLAQSFPNRIHPALLGTEYLHKLAASKIVFNSHVDHPDHFGNLRCYETTGVGSCLLTDRAAQMKDLFKDGEEIVGYKTIEEAKEKINFLLNNEKERERIAANGKARTLRDHTTKNRCKLIHETFSSFKL